MRAALASFRILGLALALVVLFAWLGLPLPWVLKVVPAAALVLSIVRPEAGLLALAGLGPFVDALSIQVNSPFAGARLLEQMVLAVVVGSTVRGWRQPGTGRLTGPALLVATVAIASAIAVQPALVLRLIPGVSAWDFLKSLGSGAYFERNALVDPLFFAALTAEGVALAVTAERLVRADAAAAGRVVGMMIAGYAGLAALTLQKVLSAALRREDAARSLADMFVNVRISPYSDPNATGSVLAMVLIAGVGLFIYSARWRWLTGGALALIAAGLWLTGSRSAFAVLGLMMVTLLGLEAARRRGKARWTVIGALTGILIGGMWFAAMYPASRNAPFAQAATARAIMARVSVDMWRSAPVFGVGIGRFYDESFGFGATALRSLNLGGDHENAHDNFLQVLAEEGLVGLGALAIVLGVVLVPALRVEWSASEPLRRFGLAGVGAYVLTWLSGHPQLQPEAALSFWLLTGTLAALTGPCAPVWWRNGLVVVAAVLVLTAPIRADWSIRWTSFEHIGVGVSLWQPALDGLRYREAGRAFSLYLPADGSSVTVPIRRAPGAADPLLLSVRVRGRVEAEERIEGDGWRLLQLRLPREHRRFELVDFLVEGPADGAGTSPVVLVGKAVPH